ncbi:MAG: OB-fold nucleic acid binding domain-containing protein, partial [Pseudomonadota bacterium]
ALETLVRSGAMDPLDLNANRARMLGALDTVLQAAEQSQRDRESGQVGLFGGMDDTQTTVSVEIPDAPVWPELQQLQAEKEALGLFLTGHPALVHRPDTKRFTSAELGRLGTLVPTGDGQRRGRGVEMALSGLICAIRRANRRLFITIEDHTGRMDVALFDEAFSLYADLLNKDEMIVVEGKVSVDDFNGGFRMTASKVMSLAEAKGRFARGVRIAVQGPCPDLVEELNAAFAPYRAGVGRVYLSYRNPRARAKLQLGDEWRINPCEELVAALGDLPGVTEAALVY